MAIYCYERHIIRPSETFVCGCAVASWLVCLPQNQAVWFRALARDVVLCSWERHFTLTQVYKWVPAN